MTSICHRLHATGFRGPLVTHGLTEEQVPACAAFLRQKLDATRHWGNRCSRNVTRLVARHPSMPIFEHDQIRFHFRETGQGVPVVLQHGLGGSVEQPFGLFVPPDGFRLLAMDCRGHGQTDPLGDPEKISIASFADDLQALLDSLQIPRAVVGGISMGAAVALNFALRFPDRVDWLDSVATGVAGRAKSTAMLPGSAKSPV